jgi:hypothetical protein
VSVEGECDSTHQQQQQCQHQRQRGPSCRAQPRTDAPRQQLLLACIPCLNRLSPQSAAPDTFVAAFAVVRCAAGLPARCCWRPGAP